MALETGLEYKRQEMSFLWRRLLKSGERENRRGKREKERGRRCLGEEENGENRRLEA